MGVSLTISGLVVKKFFGICLSRLAQFNDEPAGDGGSAGLKHTACVRLPPHRLQPRDDVATLAEAWEPRVV